MIKPLFMWTGGKTRVIPKFKEEDVLPSYKQFAGYVEPFFGGGALFCDVVNSGFNKEFVINDSNVEMMYIYYWVRENPEAFIEECQRLLNARNRLAEPERAAWFVALRKKYWAMPDLCNYLEPVPETLKLATLKAAATLYVLMLTGFMGFWQVSQDKKTKGAYGKYGNGRGLLKKYKIDPDLIYEWSTVLKRTNLFCGSYQDIEITKENSLIYVDPPYRGSVMKYGLKLTNAHQKKYARWCIEKSLQNHTVIFSNRELFDKFFSKLFRKNEDVYKNFNHTYVRGTKAAELVVVLEPERLKRGIVIIDGKEVTFKVQLLTKMLKENPIIKEFGITHQGLLEFNRSKK